MIKVLKWMALAALALVAGAVIAFVAWAWPALHVPAVRDFRLLDVELMNRAEFPACQDRDELGCLQNFPYPQMLRVRVASEQNLVEKAVAHELNLWSDAWTCSGGPDRFAAGEFIAPGPYAAGRALPYGSREGGNEFYAATGLRPIDRLVYEVYLVPKWDKPSNARDSRRMIAPPYDLADGRDVCIHIGGGNMLGGHFVGNTVRVPADVLKAALAAG